MINSRPIRVVIADDHRLVRQGMALVLKEFPNISVVAECTNGYELCEKICEWKADIVLIDVAMPEMNGIDAARLVRGRAPLTNVIMLSAYRNEEYVIASLRAGARGYLLKDSSVAEVAEAITKVHLGEIHICRASNTPVIRKYLDSESAIENVNELLTDRQRQVLKLLAESKNTKEIAGLLGLSAKTIETHRKTVMKRLGIFDVPGLVRYALRTGLLPPERFGP